MTDRITHWIADTAHKPGYYRTVCTRTIARADGAYADTIDEVQGRITCLACREAAHAYGPAAKG